MKYFAVGAAGFFGAIARYLVTDFIHSFPGVTFPWGTLAVNLTGSFMLGFIYSTASGRLHLDPHWRLAIGVGFIGSYTTFSTFSFETLNLIETGAWAQAGANVLGSLVLGLMAVFAGVVLGRLVSV